MNLQDTQWMIVLALSMKNIYFINAGELSVWCRITFPLQLLLLLPAWIWASGNVTPVPLPFLAPREGPLAHDADLGLLHLAPIQDAECLWRITTHCQKETPSHNHCLLTMACCMEAYIWHEKVNIGECCHWWAHPKGPRFESRSSQRTILLPFLALLYPNLSLKVIKVDLKT